MMATKACNTCKRELPLTEFWLQRGKPFGECKLCGRRRNAEWHRNNGAAIRLRQREARAKYLSSLEWTKRVYSNAKWRAKKHGIPFSISLQDIVLPERCPILDIPLVVGAGRGRMRRDIPNSPSLDRIDNSLGYVPGNVVVVSYRANRIKCDATVDELEAVAAFYRKIEDGRHGQGQSGRPDTEVRRLPSTLPEVLPQPAEEEGPVSARHGLARRGQSVLPPLQLGNDLP